MSTFFNRAHVHLTLLATCLPLGSALVSCGGTEAAPAPAANTTAGGSQVDPVPSPPKPWEEMSYGEKQDWMGAEVLPRMAPLFEEFDPERFANFSCDGCHGSYANGRNFEMPNPDILTLHPSGSPEQQQMVQDHPQMVRFMFNRVVPTMQTLLGAPDYDAETQTGFTCFACHPSAATDDETTETK